MIVDTRSEDVAQVGAPPLKVIKPQFASIPSLAGLFQPTPPALTARRASQAFLLLPAVVEVVAICEMFSSRSSNSSALPRNSSAASRRAASRRRRAREPEWRLQPADVPPPELELAEGGAQPALRRGVAPLASHDDAAQPRGWAGALLRAAARRRRDGELQEKRVEGQPLPRAPAKARRTVIDPQNPGRGRAWERVVLVIALWNPPPAQDEA